MPYNNKREPGAAAFAARPAQKPAARPAPRQVRSSRNTTAVSGAPGAVVFRKGGAKYNILSRQSIGRGGEGGIYPIENDRSLCCKLFKNGLTPEQAERLSDVIEKFRQIRRETPELEKYICPPEELVYDYDKTVGYLMRYVRGRPLSFYTSFEANLLEAYSRKDQLLLCEQTAYVVGMLHRAGIVIGDLDPSNIIVRSDGSIAFVDLNGAGFSLGNKSYEATALHSAMISPEQIAARGSALTRYDDLWALQTIIFKLLLPSFEPYNYKNCKEVEEDILEGNYHFYDEKLVVSDVAAALYNALPIRLKLYFMHCFHRDGDYFRPEKRPDGYNVYRILHKCRETLTQKKG